MNGTTPPYASFGSRLWAYMIDQSIIQSVALLLLTPYLVNKWPVISNAITESMNIANPASLSEMPDAGAISNDILMLVVYVVIIYTCLLVVIGIAYGTIMEASERGATYGKRYCKLRVTDCDGEQITYGAAFLRNVGVNLPTVLMNFDATIALLLCLSYLTPVMTQKRQTFYDMAAKTVVIRTV